VVRAEVELTAWGFREREEVARAEADRRSPEAVQLQELVEQVERERRGDVQVRGRGFRVFSGR